MSEWKCPRCGITQDPITEPYDETNWEVDISYLFNFFMGPAKTMYRDWVNRKGIKITCSFCQNEVKIQKECNFLKRNFRKRRAKSESGWSPWYKYPSKKKVN